MNVKSINQREVCSSSSLCCAKELKAKPTPKAMKHVTIILATDCNSPFCNPMAIGRIRSKPVTWRMNPMLATILRRLSKVYSKMAIYACSILKLKQQTQTRLHVGTFGPHKFELPLWRLSWSAGLTESVLE